MTNTPDSYADELVAARARLREMAKDLAWLAPSLRGSLGPDWHVVRSAWIVVQERERELGRQLDEHVHVREQVPSLDVADE